jgi:hypothetical protein
MVARRQRHQNPGGRERYLRKFTIGFVWLSTASVIMTAILAMEMVNGVVYVVSTVGDGSMNITAGGLLQVLLWVIAGVSVVFSAVITGILRDGRDNDGGKRVDFEKSWKDFEDEHIIIF